MINLTRKNASISNWNKECDKAFAYLKDDVVSATIMRAPNWSLPFRCHTDASQIAVGNTLEQMDDEENEYIVFYSSKLLSQTGENYAANDRESLGLVYFLETFR